MDNIREHYVANTTDNRRVFFGCPLVVRNDISIVNYFRVASVRGWEGSENVGRADRQLDIRCFPIKKKMRSKPYLVSVFARRRYILSVIVDRGLPTRNRY